MSCINDEKMVFPDAYFHPKTNAKNTIENGTKNFEAILSILFTFSTIPMVSHSFCLKYFH